MDIDYLRRRRRRLEDPTLTFHQLFAGTSTLVRATRKGPVVSWTRDTISGMGFNSSGVGVLAPHNLFDDSNTPGEGNWTATNLETPTSGQPDSDGGTSATLLQAAITSSAPGRIIQSVGPNSAEGNNKIMTIEGIFKNPSTNPGTGWLVLQLGNGNTDSIRWFFDLVNGVEGASPIIVSDAANFSHSITSLGGGFFHCVATGEITSGTTDIEGLIAGVEGDNDISTDIGDQIVVYKPSCYIGLPQDTYVENTGNTPKYSQPLFDHDPANSNNPLGVGIWEGVSQLQIQTEDLNTSWGRTNSTITANAGSAPDGTTTADDVNHDLDGAQLVGTVVAASSGATICVSAFVKQGTTGNHDWVRLQLREGDSTNGCEAWFDLTNSGTVGVSSAVGTGTLTATGTIVIGGGWFRIFLVGKIASGQTDAAFYFSNAIADNNQSEETTNSVFWWGMNVTETASPLPYIAATTASVDVDADVAVVTDVSSWHSGAAGTWFAEFSQPVLSKVVGSLFQLHDGGASDREFIFLTGTSRPTFQVITSSGNTGTITGTAISAATKVKLGFAYTTDDMEAFQDGSSEGTNISVDFPADALVTLQVGANVTSSGQLNGHLAKLRYYNVQKSDAFMLALTT